MATYPGYRIKNLICHGSNTTLYLAEREQDGSLVAIRTPTVNNPSPDDINKLKNDYEMTCNLQIPGIARALEFSSQAAVPFLVLEYSGNTTLAAEIAATSNDLRAFLHYSIQIARILGEIHKHDLVHRDIKPQNIIIDQTNGCLSITDFSIAAHLGETNSALHTSSLEGSLPYMSPEQTGRMNRAVDNRSDLYSLGITLYEMLVGRPPFTDLDPLEMVHAQIARTPAPPAEVNLNVPFIVSEIVMRLLAKNPDDRYQTAFGLALDLRECLDQWESKGSIEVFRLGSMDVSERFIITHKLYGRDKELDRLTRAVERVSQGRSEVLLISGTAGVGKSALVNEMQRPAIKQRSYFISGKYDQNKLDVPYSALVQAFQDLTRQLLMENEDQIEMWRERLLQALGTNAQVLIDVIPDLELIIGKQPPIPALDAAEALTRFSTLFERFFGVFCRKGHPLVMFLDDLQWADSASLHLLKLMTSHGDASFKYLLVICAYRDSEIVPGHPSYSMFDVLSRSSLSLEQIYLHPLTQYDVANLLSDTLNRSPIEVEPLANLVHRKTGGNPFFARQFLWMLQQENFLTFDPNSASWLWNLERIEHVGVTDNIIDLMTTRIKRLPSNSQECLKLAACIGNRFDLQTLSVISRQPEDATMNLLDACIAEGLILSEDSIPFTHNSADQMKTLPNPVFRFLHDRVQQAAYNLIPESEKSTIHFRIGELLLDHIEPDSLRERIFEVVNHLNLSIELLTVQSAKIQLASLNLLACKKAKSSVAFVLALRHVVIANELLASDTWDKEYDLTLDIHMERMDCELINGMATEAERTFGVILKRAHTDLDRARVYNMQVIALTNMGRYKEAIDCAKTGLRLCGVVLPDKPNALHILWEVSKNRIIRGHRSVRDLVDLPELADPKLLTAISILGNLQVAAYYGDARTVVLSQLITVNLSILHGNSPESSVAYAAMSLILCSTFLRFKEGNEYALLALDLCNRFPDVKYTCQVNYILGAFAFHWVEPIKKSLEYLQKAYDMSIEAGTIVWLGNSATTTVRNNLMSGLPLDQIQSQALDFFDSVQKVKHPSSGDFMKITSLFVSILQNGIENEINRDAAESLKLLRELETKGPEQNLASLQLYLAIAFYVLGQPAVAHDMVLLVQSQISRGVLYSSTSIPECNFYQTLISAAIFPSAPAGTRKALLRQIKKNQKKMKFWANSCPKNYMAHYLIAEAECMRIQGNFAKAMLLYDQGIESAHENGFLQIHAIANELAGRSHLAQAHTQKAVSYLAEAHNSFAMWNAHAKVKSLEKEFPFLIPSSHKTGVSLSYPHSTGEGLDLYSVMKASQSLAEEMNLERLLEKLVRIIVENAGAQKAIVVLNQDGHLIVEAQSSIDSEEVIIEPVPLDEACFLSRSIVNYAARTRVPQVINDATREERFIGDPFISQNQSRSILCLPMVYQGNLIGIIYLENNLTTHAFTPERVEVLKLLSSQIAISLENSRLYTNLERSEAKYRDLLDNMLDAVIIIQDRKLMYVNRTMETSLGYSSEESIGHYFDEFMTPEQASILVSNYDRRVAGETFAHEYEIGLTHRNGQTVNAIISSTQINYQGRPAIQATLKDITDRKQAEEELRRHKEHLEELVIERTKELAEVNDNLRAEVEQRRSAEERIRHMAYHDVLTGLPNRKHFQERMEQELSRAQRLQHCLGVMFIDLDWFKNVNDTYGHEIGDKLLCEVADRLKNSVRKVDIISRLGGDEFTAVLVDLADPEKAFVVANRIFRFMAPPVTIDSIELDITCSIGISIYPQHGDTVEELLRKADDAMYEAKQKGKNNYRMYTPEASYEQSLSETKDALAET